MKDNKFERLQRSATKLRHQFLQSGAGVFDQILSAHEIAQATASLVPAHRDRIYPPLETLRLFVSQVLSTDRACQDVVGRRLSERIAQGQSVSALGTSAYCEARKRLPLSLPTQLGGIIARALEGKSCEHWRWQGRCVKLFDGTVISMPDTPLNQLAYPQSREQKPGLGFPVARIGALIGLASGAIIGYALVACEGKGTGEQTLLAQLIDKIDQGDVLLADALLATWWIIEAAQRRGADIVMAQHGKRITDFTRGRSLGVHDHIVQWPRPLKPKTMSAQEYARYPESISLRETEINGRVLVSTMLDPARIAASELARLYKMRWNIEIDFRTIKATLEMDVLRCKSPEMIAKEVSVYFLAYNLVRWAMAKAAYITETLPRVLSFSGARRLLNTFADELRRQPLHKTAKLISVVLHAMGSRRLPYRPNRIEPRAKKRRPKNLPLLTVPRNIAREMILAQRALNRVP